MSWSFRFTVRTLACAAVSLFIAGSAPGQPVPSELSESPFPRRLSADIVPEWSGRPAIRIVDGAGNQYGYDGYRLTAGDPSAGSGRRYMQTRVLILLK